MPSGRYPVPGGFPEERRAVVSLSDGPWAGVIRPPVVRGVQTLALSPGKVPDYKQGDDDDQDSNQDCGQHALSHPAGDGSHARDVAHDVRPIMPGHFGIGALGFKGDPEPIRRRNRHSAPSRQPVLHLKSHCHLTLIGNRSAHAGSYLEGKIGILLC